MFFFWPRIITFGSDSKQKWWNDCTRSAWNFFIILSNVFTHSVTPTAATEQWRLAQAYEMSNWISEIPFDDEFVWLKTEERSIRNDFIFEFTAKCSFMFTSAHKSSNRCASSESFHFLFADDVNSSQKQQNKRHKISSTKILLMKTTMFNFDEEEESKKKNIETNRLRQLTGWRNKISDFNCNRVRGRNKNTETIIKTVTIRLIKKRNPNKAKCNGFYRLETDRHKPHTNAPD